MNELRKGLDINVTYKYNKSMIYKMVATLAEFDPKYQALDEILLNSSNMEASSIVNFRGIKKEGTFHTNPAWIDALSQVAGFVMNANDQADLQVEVFVNHGWNSFQSFRELSSERSYQSHVTMRQRSGKMWEGNIFVLDGENLVAMFSGIAVRCLPLCSKSSICLRRILKFPLASRCCETTPSLHLVNGERSPVWT